MPGPPPSDFFFFSFFFLFLLILILLPLINPTVGRRPATNPARANGLEPRRFELAHFLFTGQKTIGEVYPELITEIFSEPSDEESERSRFRCSQVCWWVHLYL